MQADFWHRKWEKGEIGFHEAEANTLMRENIHKLALDKGSRIFLPLCGKTRDIHWLLEQGYHVAGAELSEMAVKELFADLKLIPTIVKQGSLTHYSAENIDIFVGDIFNLTEEQLGKVDAIYDRAALVALPEAMRQQYTQHLTTISHGAAQLLITFEYDQSLMQGPPFSIGLALIKQYYQSRYSIELLTSKTTGGLKASAAVEHICLLKPLSP